MVTFILMPVAILFPLMTVNHFEGNTYQMSLVEIVWGSGMLLVGVIVGIWKIETRKMILINISYLVLGLYMLLSGCLPPEEAIGEISAPFYNSPFRPFYRRIFLLLL